MSLLKSSASNSECHGVIFRCVMSVYKSRKGYAQRIEMVRQKRLSCHPGICPTRNGIGLGPRCEGEWLDEFLDEESWQWEPGDGLPLDGALIHGAYYGIRIDQWKDWESGNYEVDGVFFVPIYDPVEDGVPMSAPDLKERLKAEATA